MREDYSHYRLSAKENCLYLSVGYAGFFALMMVFYKSILLAAVGGCLCLFFLPLYRQHLCDKRRELFRLQFKDFLYALSASLAAGRQMEKALQEAETSLSTIYGRHAPLSQELTYINKAVQYHRESPEDLLRGLAKRSGIEECRDFVDVYCLCRQLGGNTEEIITRAAEVLTEKMSILREIRMITAQKQFEGRIISAMPVLVVAGLNVFYPSYLDVMYQTLVGRLLMTIALGGIGLAFVLSQKLLRIEI